MMHTLGTQSSDLSSGHRSATFSHDDEFSTVAESLSTTRGRKRKSQDPVPHQVVPTTLDLRKARRIARRSRVSLACVSCNTSRKKCNEYRPCVRCKKIGKADSCTYDTKVCDCCHKNYVTEYARFPLIFLSGRRMIWRSWWIWSPSLRWSARWLFRVCPLGTRRHISYLKSTGAGAQEKSCCLRP